MTLTIVVRSMRRHVLLGLVAGAGLLIAAGPAQGASLLLEKFDDITTLTGTGWVQTNNSAPAGVTGWFQGNDGIFPSQAGAPDAYIAANFENAGAGGDISNWLISEPDVRQRPDDCLLHADGIAGHLCGPPRTAPEHQWRQRGGRRLHDAAAHRQRRTQPGRLPGFLDPLHGDPQRPRWSGVRPLRLSLRRPRHEHQRRLHRHRHRLGGRPRRRCGS